MMKMGHAMGAVKNAIERDGLDPSVLDGDFYAPLDGVKGGTGRLKFPKTSTGECVSIRRSTALSVLGLW